MLGHGGSFVVGYPVRITRTLKEPPLSPPQFNSFWDIPGSRRAGLLIVLWEGPATKPRSPACPCLRVLQGPGQNRAAIQPRTFRGLPGVKWKSSDAGPPATGLDS